MDTALHHPSRLEDVSSANRSESLPAPSGIRCEMSAPETSQEPLSPIEAFDSRKIAELYSQSEYQQMADEFLKVLDHLQLRTYTHLSQATSRRFNDFATTFLFYFTREDFRPGDPYLLKFIDLNSIIANLVAMSDWKTTDTFVSLVLQQPHNYGRLLALYSQSNSLEIDIKLLFNTHAQFSNRWLLSCFKNYSLGCSNEVELRKLRKFISYTEAPLFSELAKVNHAYFAATYIDFENDGLIKAQINRSFQQLPLCKREIVNKPVKGRVAVLTSMWFPTQSVYRSQYPFLKELAKTYDMVLIALGKKREDFDTSLFSDVRYYSVVDDANDMSAIDPNDFELAYFPDIGMSTESILLSNMRIAPIQVSNYGHPVSTYGSKIDYWIGGRETEVIETAQSRYSERLVLISGSGQLPVPIHYSPTFPQLSENTISIACSWTAMKTNSEHLDRLSEIQRRSNVPLKFRFFPGGSLRMNQYLPFANRLRDRFGAKCVDVFSNINYATYMSELERCHFALDAYPFGGYNTSIDLLNLRKPIITLEGDRFYSRSTAFCLRKVGLGELIAHDPQEYITKAIHFINNSHYRNDVQRRLNAVDLSATLMDTATDAASFVQAIDRLCGR